MGSVLSQVWLFVHRNYSSDCVCEDMASANPANVKRRKRRDVQRNVRDLNFLIMEDESEEEVFPEAVDVGLNAEGYDRDPEAELVHNAVVLELSNQLKILKTIV